MKQRIVTAVIGLIILSLVLILGNIGLSTAITVISVIGINELYSSFDKTRHNVDKTYRTLGVVAIISMYLGRIIINKNINNIAFLVFSFCAIAYSMFKYNDKSLSNIAIFILSVIYIPCSLWCIYDIYSNPKLCIWVGYIFVIAFGSDTMAYFAGVFFGKRKIVPKISPNKTLEGFVGGAIGCTLLVYVYTFVASFFVPNIKFNLINLVAYGLFAIVGAFISQIGDLLASSIKRVNDIKDFSDLMPGHGGILDRFDSILLVSPYVYMVVVLFF